MTKRIEEARQKVRVGGVYYHWRDPSQHYRVISVGICEWSEELCVVYQHIDGSELTWVRRLDGEDGWLTPVEKEGTSHPRFYIVEE